MKKIFELIKKLLSGGSIAEKTVQLNQLEVEVKEVKEEIADVVEAAKEVVDQVEDVAAAVKGKARKGRKKK